MTWYLTLSCARRFKRCERRRMHALTKSGQMPEDELLSCHAVSHRKEKRMNPFRFALAAGLLAAGGARAQLVDPASASQLQAKPSAEAKAFARIPSLVESSYVRNEAENPNDRLMEGFRTDPRLVAGVNLTPYLAIETGYRERFDRGFHNINPGRSEDVSGALGVKGFHSYLAARLTAPISDSLSAYGKLGIAYSERKGGDNGNKTEVDAGLYISAGAKYRLNEKAAVSAEVQRYGDTASKWGSATNGNSKGAKVKLGF
jgi:hypothetical protein